MQIISKDDAKAAGLKRYFTGKACNRLHISERFLSGSCVQCYKERMQQPENREKKKASDKRYRSEQDKEKVSAYFKEYYQSRKLEFSERSAKYNSENKQKIKKAYRAYYSDSATRSKIIARSRETRRKEGYKESNREYQRKWRERKRQEFLKENPDFVNKFGYRPDATGYFYLLFIDALDRTFVGYGITNRNVARITEHRKSLGSFGFAIRECVLFKFKSGYDAVELEQIFDKLLSDKPKLDVIGFKTESGECDHSDFKIMEQRCAKFAADKHDQ